MQDAEALKGKSLAELREIGRSMGIKAQMRKQELLDRILELSARGDSSPAGAEAAQPEVPVPEGEENVPEKKRRGRRPKGYVRIESVENPSADEAVPEQEAPKTPEEAPVSEVRADAHPEQVVRQRTVPAFTASPEKGKPGRPKKRDRLAFAKSAKAIRRCLRTERRLNRRFGAVPEDRAKRPARAGTDRSRSDFRQGNAGAPGAGLACEFRSEERGEGRVSRYCGGTGRARNHARRLWLSAFDRL